MTILTAPFLALIRLYQRIHPYFFRNCCRFVPSCSQYAAEALQKHGLFKGGALACWRILRCNPFGKPGYDPVP
jgi:putative membrane protein insertion efficiency factor